MAEKPTINEFFTGRSVFVTGATGFIGKVLLEKLLRSCPGIDTIYFLMREKKGKSISERLQEMKEKPLFDVLKSQNPDALEKLKPLSGDIMQLGLGLSYEDRRVLEDRVSIVFHFAASVKFNDSLRKSTILNVRGTRETLNLAANMKNIKIFLHVSTAYCNLEQKIVHEVLYPFDIGSQDVIDAVEKIDDKTLETLTPKILGEHFPNTYTFGKRLAEQLVDEFKEIMPVIIVRPSITVSTLEEPVPGWIDTINGPIGLFQAGGKGLLHAMYLNPDVMADYIPADTVIKPIIVSVWKKATESWLKDTSIYHLTSCYVKRMSTAEIINLGVEVMRSMPRTRVVYYPTTFITNSRVVSYIAMMLLNLLPAVLMDLALKISGRKPMILDIQRRIYTAMKALRYFMFNEWDFLNNNMLKLQNYVLESDFKTFNYDMDCLGSYNYFKNWAIGAERYLMKEPEESVEAAKRHYARLKVIHYVVKITSTLLFTWFLFSLSQYVFHWSF